jgi:hypothetical protein
MMTASVSEDLDTAEKPARWPELAVKLSIAAFLLSALLMVALVDMPPVLDFPNHYARIWLISGGINDPSIAKMYGLDWSRASTNIGIDLIAYYVGPLVGAGFLSRTFLFLAIVLPPLGAIALNRHLSGQWHPYQIAFLFFAWCATLIGGFMNFQIGLGLALFLAIADRKLHKFGPVTLFIWRAVIFALLLINHAIAACYFLLVIGALEFSAQYAVLRSRPSVLRIVARVALAAAACALPVLVLLTTAKSLPGGSDPLGYIVWNGTLVTQLFNLMSAFWSYRVQIDIAFLAILLWGFKFIREGGRNHVHAGLQLAFILLIVVSVASPEIAFQTGWISWRFPIMAALTACVMVLPEKPIVGRRLAIATALIVLAVFGRTAWISWNWWSYQSDVADVRTLLADVPPGSKVLPAGHYISNDAPFLLGYRQFAYKEDTFRHLAVLAVPQSKSFAPNLFTAKGKQPVVVSSAYSDADIAEGNLIPPSYLMCPAVGNFMAQAVHYLLNWRSRFDYVLLLNADLPDRYSGFDEPPGLDVVQKTRFAVLYRIDKAWQPGTEVPSDFCAKELEALQKQATTNARR